MTRTTTAVPESATGAPSTGALSCPTATHHRDGTPHTIVGCGSTNLTGPDHEGLYDCLDCGIFFDPNQEASVS